MEAVSMDHPHNHIPWIHCSGKRSQYNNETKNHLFECQKRCSMYSTIYVHYIDDPHNLSLSLSLVWFGSFQIQEKNKSSSHEMERWNFCTYLIVSTLIRRIWIGYKMGIDHRSTLNVSQIVVHHVWSIFIEHSKVLKWKE